MQLKANNQSMNLSKFHYITRFHEQWKKLKDREALRKRIDNKWESITWNEFGVAVTKLSRSLLNVGVKIQDKVAIFSYNMPEWTMIDIAIMQVRGISVPIHATSTAEQTAYIINDSESSIVFVGAQEQYDKVKEIADQCNHLKTIVAIRKNIKIESDNLSIYWDEFIQQHDEKEVESELQHCLESKSMDDLFTLIYTSGTTGQPKGVMLDYNNLAFQLYMHDIRLIVREDDVSLTFLPLSHVYERAWTAYILHSGAVNCYLEDTQLIKEGLKEVRPTVMCAVPRFYEKIYATVYDTVSRSPFYKRVLFSLATRTGKKVVSKKIKGEEPSWLSKKLFNVFDKMIFSKFRSLMGGNIRYMPCGGAKLEPSIGLFFHAIGINVKLGYGLTETLATLSCWEDEKFDIDSVGKVLPHTEIRIGEDNEILVKGGMVMKGYYKMPEETESVFTKDGFFRTGDAGSIDEKGNIFITDRIKELMKTSNGKYISPQHIEGKVGKDNLIEQIAVIADGRKFVSALVVPNFQALGSYLKDLKIKYKTTKELVKKEEVVNLFFKRIERFQRDLPEFEKIKHITLLPNPFSIENNEITPTLKLKRKVIYSHYRKEIEAMYS